MSITFICTCGDCNLSIRVELSAKRRRIRIRNSLLKARTTLCANEPVFGCISALRSYSYLGWGVLVTFNFVESLFCGVNRKLGRVIATGRGYNISKTGHSPDQKAHLQEPLAHVHDRLNGGSRSGFIDN